MSEFKASPVPVQKEQSSSDSDDEGEENAQVDLESPHGTFGNVLHALSFGLLGNQKMRTDRPVATEYKVKSKNSEVFGPIDNHPYEEYSEEGYDHTHPKQTRLVKVKKSDTEKIKEMQEIRQEHEESVRREKEEKEQERKELEEKEAREKKKKEKILKKLKERKDERLKGEQVTVIQPKVIIAQKNETVKLNNTII